MNRLIIALLLFGATNAYSWTPQNSTTQVGGFSGLVSAGMGWKFNQRYQTDILAGYVPSKIGGEDLYSLTWKNQIEWKEFSSKWTPHIGISTLLSLDEDAVVPKRAPFRYYPLTNLMWAPYIGGSFNHGLHSFFFEITTLDVYLEAKIRNWHYLKWRDITTYGFGYRLYFEVK